MLVLTRKAGEEIVIGDDIRITVVEVAPGRVKIGISAPKSVRVDRAEVHEKKQGEPAATPVAVGTDTPLATPVVVPPLVNRIAEKFPAPNPAPANPAAIRPLVRRRLPLKPR